MGPGSVAHFTDGQKTHTGVVLDMSEDGSEAWTLFLTSNPAWNKRCRPVTLDELSLCGFPKKSAVDTYFAPVVRPSQDACQSGITFPSHRVADLSEEFGPSPFLPPAISLPDDIFPPVRERPASFHPTPMAFVIDKALKRIGGLSNWGDKDGERLARIAWGLEDLPRSELIGFCSALPGLSKFFTRRASHSLSLQIRWARIGSVLEGWREKKGVPAQLMARRMGITDREYRGFENGLLCPSWDEMLTIVAMLPGIPDEWTLPTSVPLLADCLLTQMRRRRWSLNTVSSQLRLPLSRVRQVFVDAAFPSDVEMKKLRSLFRDLPPWRPTYRDLDCLHLPERNVPG